MGSALGVMKVAAARVGLTLEDYQARKDAGEKWCGGCRTWHGRAEFDVDRSRSDGLKSTCRMFVNSKRRANYVRAPRAVRGRRFVDARNGDKEQARRRVNYLVEAELLAPPNNVPCTDCGHVWAEGERRHEYDHHLGYAAEHHEHVEAVCTTCHHHRETARAGSICAHEKSPERVA